MPYKLEVRASQIDGAGDGVFAGEDIPTRTCLGTYMGKRLTCIECMEMRDTRYVYEVFHPEGTTFIDGGQGGNWTSMVNGARTDVERTRINVESVQIDNNIVFFTTRDISMGEELLLDYGNRYWHDS